VGSHRLSYLSIDRPAPFLLIAQSVVGLFRSAGGLVLLSGGKLGPQISCRSSPLNTGHPRAGPPMTLGKRSYPAAANIKPRHLDGANVAFLKISATNRVCSLGLGGQR
jgi:hypothetical protein